MSCRAEPRHLIAGARVIRPQWKIFQLSELKPNLLELFKRAHEKSQIVNLKTPQTRNCPSWQEGRATVGAGSARPCNRVARHFDRSGEISLSMSCRAQSRHLIAYICVISTEVEKSHSVIARVKHKKFFNALQRAHEKSQIVNLKTPQTRNCPSWQEGRATVGAGSARPCNRVARHFD